MKNRSIYQSYMRKSSNDHRRVLFKSFREEHTYYVDSYDEFKEKIEKGFVFAHWDGTAETAEKIQDETKATIRCLPNGEYVRDVNEK